MTTKKVQAYSKNEEGSLMSWLNVPEKWDTQKIINYIQKEITSTIEHNIMWIKVSGKRILDNTGKSRKTK